MLRPSSPSARVCNRFTGFSGLRRIILGRDSGLPLWCRIGERVSGGKCLVRSRILDGSWACKMGGSPATLPEFLHFREHVVYFIRHNVNDNIPVHQRQAYRQPLPPTPAHYHTAPRKPSNHHPTATYSTPQQPRGESVPGFALFRRNLPDKARSTPIFRHYQPTASRACHAKIHQMFGDLHKTE